MKFDCAVIGGSGIGEALRKRFSRQIHVPTKFGLVRAIAAEVEGRSVLVISRHGAGHRLLPSQAPYRAYAECVRSLNIPVCLATAAVGSLRAEWPIGTLVNCSDFIDLSGRNASLFGHTVVHRDFTNPFSERVRAALSAAAGEENIGIQASGVYCNVNGPRYETPAEISAFGTLGADVVGMTAGTEAVVMKEAEIDYGCVGIVTNLATGISGTVLGHGEVVKVMRERAEDVLHLLFKTVVRLGKA